MSYNFVADSFHSKKLCRRPSLRKVHFWTENGRFAFWAPQRGLQAIYDDHLGLMYKRVVYFLLVIIELFIARCYGWGFSEYRLKIGFFLKKGVGFYQNFRYKRLSPTNHFSCRKTGMTDLSYGIKYAQKFLSSYCNFDRRTNSRADRQIFRSCITLGICWR